MKRTVLLFIIVAGALLYSCEGLFNCIDGNGELVVEKRAVAEFTSINNSSQFDVTVTYDLVTSLRVQSDKNLQKYIQTYVESGELIIEPDNNRCLAPNNRILIDIRCPYINKVVLSGTSDLELEGFEVDNFDISLSGSGNIDVSRLIVDKRLQITNSGFGNVEIHGKASDADYILSGSGDIDGEVMKTLNCNIVHSGSGNIWTYVQEELEVLLSGLGNVYYYGDPEQVTERITGAGRIIKK